MSRCDHYNGERLDKFSGLGLKDLAPLNHTGIQLCRGAQESAFGFHAPLGRINSKLVPVLSGRYVDDAAVVQ